MECCNLLTRRGSFMKILKYAFVVTCIVSGLIFARSGDGNTRTEINNLKNNNQHYWVKDHSDNDKGQLDRKRSNKRRRKIRKPIKGLR